MALDPDGGPLNHTVTPGTVEGTVRVPGSKSVTHRAYLLAAQSRAPCTVAHPLRSADTDATLACLHRLGHHAQIEEKGIRFIPSDPRPPTEPLDCRNAGTTLRLLAGTAARFPWTTHFTGDASLQTRPNGPLHEALTDLGATIEGGHQAPFSVTGPLRAGDVSLPPQTSSQYGSSLLLALPFIDGDSRLTMQAPVASSPYLDVSLDVAAAFGLRIAEAPTPQPPEDGPPMPSDRVFEVPGRQAATSDGFIVESDWSTAAFPLVAGAITDGLVRIEGLRLDSRQGDKAILDHLRSFGAAVTTAPDGSYVTVAGGNLETPGTVDVSATPDMFPALAVLAACSKGITEFTGGESLRAKESDRIHAMVTGLRQMGIVAVEREAGALIHGGRLQGATVQAYHDHRIHMAFAIAGLAAAGPTTIDGADSAAVSYPDFHADLERLQGVTA